MAASISETDLRRLAERLQFKVEQYGDRFTLTRTADVSRPVVEKGLTLSQAQELLERWKLRGLGGGQPPLRRPAGGREGEKDPRAFLPQTLPPPREPPRPPADLADRCRALP